MFASDGFVKNRCQASFFTFSSFEVRFESVVLFYMWRVQAKHDLWGSNVKVGKSLTSI